MKILEIREAAFPVRSTMRNAAFSFAEMTTSIVAVRTDQRVDGRAVVGYAFNSTGRYACGAPMRERFIPRLLRATPDSLLDAAGVFDPARAVQAMLVGEKPGGHAERSIPIGTIETALWDALAKSQQLPLADAISRRYRDVPMAVRVFCYVGGGWYQPGATAQDVADEVRRHLDAGYTQVKIKVGGLPLAQDLKRVEAALGVLPNASCLAVDANAKFSIDEALAYAKGLAPYALRWFEEPCEPHDYASMAAVAAVYPHALATGENLYATQDVLNLVRFGGWREGKDLIQVDPPQAYGVAAYASMVQTLERLEPLGWSAAAHFPHGGNQMSLALVAGLGLGGCEAYPGVFGAFGGYADDARVENGWLPAPTRPGIGFEGQHELYRLLATVSDGW